MQEQSYAIVGQVIFFLIPDWKGMKKDKQEGKNGDSLHAHPEGRQKSESKE